jgi:putative flippase GtrA
MAVDRCLLQRGPHLRHRALLRMRETDMLERLTRLWRLRRTPAGQKMVRYAAVSVVSSAFSFCVLAVVYGALRLWSEVPSTLFTNVVAGAVSYNLLRRWVWGKSGRSHLTKEVIPFWVMWIAGMALSLFAASVAHHVAESHHLQHLARTALLLGVNVAAWGSLWLIRFLVLNRLFRSEQAQSPNTWAEVSPSS